MTTFVLIPGAGGEAWYWHRVVPLLEAAGFGAVAADLPAADPEASFDDYADAVVRAAEAARVPRGQSAASASASASASAEHPPAVDDDLVVVCQSLGGFTGVVVCERLRARMLVFVSAMIPALGETAGEWWGDTGQAAAAAEFAAYEGRSAGADFDPRQIFFHDVPAEVTAQAFARPEPRQSEGIFASGWPATEWPAVDIRVIAGRYDRLFPLPFMQRVSRERLGSEPQIIDSGHLSALSAPDALAKLLVRYASRAD